MAPAMIRSAAQHWPILYRTALRCDALSSVGSMIAAAEPAKIDFATHVQPIFVEHCYQCHGPDKQEVGLRLDQRPAALKGGDSGALVRGRQEQASELCAADHGRRAMSGCRRPDEQTKPLSAARNCHDHTLDRPGRRVARAQGGRLESLGVSTDRAAGAAGGARTDLGRGAIDRFVLGAAGSTRHRALAPKPIATRSSSGCRTTCSACRRSRPRSTRSWPIASPDAYEKLVDRLLASPHFGERWGRHWLDLARYADSDGYEKDNPRPDAWRYRDWVIDADQRRHAVRPVHDRAARRRPAAGRDAERAAGHGLSPPDADQHRRRRRPGAVSRRGDFRSRGHHRQRVAGADRRLRPVPHAQVRPDLARGVLPALRLLQQRRRNRNRSAADRRDAWPSGKQGSRRRRTQADQVASPSWREARAELAARLPEWEVGNRRQPQPRRSSFIRSNWSASESRAGGRVQDALRRLVPGRRHESGRRQATRSSPRPTCQGDHRLSRRGARARLAGRPRARAAPTRQLRAQRVSRVRRGHGGDQGRRSRRASRRPQADFSQGEYPAGRRHRRQGADRLGDRCRKTGQRSLDRVRRRSSRSTPQRRPWLQLVLEPESWLAAHDGPVSRLRPSPAHDPLLEHSARAFATCWRSPAKRSPERASGALLDYYRSATTRRPTSWSTKWRSSRSARPRRRRDEGPRARRSERPKPRTSHMLHARRFLAARGRSAAGHAGRAAAAQAAQAGAADRLDLARWLVDPANPLDAARDGQSPLAEPVRPRASCGRRTTSACAASRRRIPSCSTGWPAEFVARGWSRKALIRTIVDVGDLPPVVARTGPSWSNVDPHNVCLPGRTASASRRRSSATWRWPPAGLLSDKIGGPSVFPPLPPDIAELSYASNFKWVESTGEDRYRRGMYTFFKRTAPYPDADDVRLPRLEHDCASQRRASNTPLQALTTLNNEVFFEAAQALARRVARRARRRAIASAARARASRLRACARADRAKNWPHSAELLNESLRLVLPSHPRSGREAGRAVSSRRRRRADEAAAWVATARIDPEPRRIHDAGMRVATTATTMQPIDECDPRSPAATS